jgi:hypothetical protein
MKSAFAASLLDMQWLACNQENVSQWSDMQEGFEDTKVVIIIHKSKNRQHNCQKKKDKRTNNDLQIITHKTKVRVARTPLKPGVNSCALS